jgi:thiol-disulfide isomerase/thioredoxin
MLSRRAPATPRRLPSASVVAPAVLITLAGLLAAGAARAQAAAPPPLAENPIERLVRNREYEKALIEIEKLRAEKGQGGLADAESELWAAHASSRKGDHETARERYQRIARRYPDEPAGREAAIEAAATLVREAGDEGGSKSQDKKRALQAVTELEALAARYRESDPATAARSLYIAGNAYWIADQAAQANAAWTDLTTLPDDDYAAKALYRLATSASRDLDNARATELYTRCIKEHSQAAYASRCAKNLGRLAVVGTPAPALVVETWLNSAPVDLAQHHGKVVLLWFFASWCPHCKDTMPEMAALAERMKGQPFEILGITANTRGQTTAIAKAFVEDPQWQIGYPVAVDLGNRTSDAFGAGSVPSAALVDKAGVIRWADHPTYLHDGMIEALLAE